ncbi:MAG: hypothetical protein ABIH86_06690 [Planctomycetota bacterium]
MRDLRPFIDSVATIIESHSLGTPGGYRRWNSAGPDGRRDISLNAYGCADAANILYTIGRFPSEPDERTGWIKTLRALQDPATGLFNEATHHPIHTTAHCVAALELFDALPAHPLTQLAHLRDPDAMIAFLEALDWRNNPWNASHQGAGLYAALVMTGQTDADWRDRYFRWLWDETDPATGFQRQGCVAPVSAGGGLSLFPHLAGSFHYLFNIEHDRRPIRYPERMIDSALAMFEANAFPIGRSVGFAEIDWLYCINRAFRQSGWRFNDCRAAFRTFADRYLDFLFALQPETDEGLNDLHRLFGCICALAELQAALPGELLTARPLHLPLDRRPFI